MAGKLIITMVVLSTWCTMFGFGIFLMALADKLTRRKYDGGKRCDVCKQDFMTFEEAEVHRRNVHSDAVPN